MREPELWIIAVGDRDSWGGATVAWSEDGDWYPENAEGEIGPHAVVGELLDPLGAAVILLDSLLVALSFRGQLRAGDLAALERQQTLCYLGDSTGTRFELLCYSGATLLGLRDDAHLYKLSGPLRRGCYRTSPFHHPHGSRFARLDSNVARITLPDRLVVAHATLALRIVSENGIEAVEDPDDVEPILYQIQGGFYR